MRLGRRAGVARGLIRSTAPANEAARLDGVVLEHFFRLFGVKAGR